MEKGILYIDGKIQNLEISNDILKLKTVFQQLDYEVWTLKESDEFFDQKLKDFIDILRKNIECKAVISCNVIGIEELYSTKDFLYVILLEEHPSHYIEYLKRANENSLIFCFDEKYVDYIKIHCLNILDTNIKYVPLTKELDEESRITIAAQIALEIQEQVAIRRGTLSILKLLIQNGLNNGNFDQIYPYIVKYKERNPKDIDVIVMETIYNLYKNDFDLALEYALEGVRKYPCNGDMYFNLATVYKKQENWYKALWNYGKANTIYFYTESLKREKLNLPLLLSECREEYEKNPKNDSYMTYDEMNKNKFGLWEATFRNISSQIIGKYYWESEIEKRYVGTYRDCILRNCSNNDDLIHAKGEFIKVTEGNEYSVGQYDTEVLLPIAVENQKTNHEIWDGDKRYIILQVYNKHFNYYRLPSGAKIRSSMKAYYGKPIPLCQKEDKKKLILNIFVDGLGQYILNGENFRRNMPYTARFFEKGTVCTNVYNTAEWTYPSIVNYVTGLDTTHHMLFHNMLDGAIPKEYPTIAEYFQEKGYFTSKMCGNWRIIPTYGHARGYDQFIYQHQWTGFKAEMIIGDVIDHIEAFKETNQFLWMSIGDLHDVADGIDLPLSVQNNMKLEERVIEGEGTTSVKQSYSLVKIKAYEKMAKRIDILLNTLYQYLESNYKDEDIIVSLFSDHGQGYFLKDDEHFMASGRSNVAFMFRGAGVKAENCDEIISTSDYIRIMCKLADIEMKDIEIDGKLPIVFGGNGREYALSESIHPKDPYYAAIYAKDINFYFENPFPVQDDGRFYLKEYRAWITDKNGNEINDWEKFNIYLNIVLEHIRPLLIYD